MLEDYRLKVFEKVAELGSFTKAADALRISQPAVSQNISELEKSLAVRLFERKRGDVSLTEQGRLFRKYALQILHGYELVNGVFDASHDDAVTVFISAEIRCLLAADLLKVVRTLRPNLKVIFTDDASNAEITVFGISDKKRKDRQIKIEVTVLPENHPYAILFEQALDLI